MDTPKNQAEQVLSLGEQFRQARQGLNLTLEEAAEKINLRPVILQYLENNEFIQKNIPATFMKGYVRNYAKFLKLPESLWDNDAIFGEDPKNDLNRNARVRRATTPHASYSRWLGILTGLVLLVVASMTALWWWENYQQSNSERDNMVQNYVASEEQTTNTEKTNAALLPPTTPAVENTNVASAPVTTEAAPDLTTVPAVATTEVAPAMENSAPATAENMLSQHLNQATNVENNAVESNAEENKVVSGDLQIEITAATSWITVKDANRKNLAQKEYKQGEVLTFDGKGPYALTIGAPANVKITYKGEAYPLKIDGRVARIKLQ
ncbi:RodZ domain-containing protein [Pasteurellaceae bacterium 22721_9_1]